jgi:hypothetical protein
MLLKATRNSQPLRTLNDDMTTDHALTKPAVLPRLLFEREPGWQFSLMLVLEILFLFVAVPALGAGDANRDVVSLLQLLLAATAIVLVAKTTWLRLALATSFGLIVVTRFVPGFLPHATTLGMSFFYNFLVTAVMCRAVFGPGEVNHHRIAGAIFIYLNIALLFALAFTGLYLFTPDAINGFSSGASPHLSDAVHFSFTTLTAIGDSPVIPASPFAKSLADLEATIGHLFPAVLLARLVGLHVSRSG